MSESSKRKFPKSKPLSRFSEEEAVQDTDENASSHDVPKGNRKEVLEEGVPPGDSRTSLEDSCGEEVHVGDAVLVPQGDEGRDGSGDNQDSGERIFSMYRKEHREGHEPVAENSPEEPLREAQGDFPLSKGGDSRRNNALLCPWKS